MGEPEEDLDEQVRMENLKKLSMGKGRGGKSSKSPNMKSPKAGKAGKTGKISTTWDPVLYGGKVNKEEAKLLDRTVGKPEDQDQDNQLTQFVPDLNVVGKSKILGSVDYVSEDEEEEVGPAVKAVGNEAIDQLVKFNAALADHSSQENPHTIDGIVLTKFDTIDDKVGSSISMTYISGQPIVFVGTGQTYTDLKSLNAKAVVTALMK